MKSVPTTPVRAFRVRARVLAAAICALALFTSAADAAQRKPKDSEAAPAAAAKAYKPKKSARIKFEKGGGETRAERDRRLQRECRGLPNAGACLGYGS